MACECYQVHIADQNPELPTQQYLVPEEELRRRVAGLQQLLREHDLAAALIGQNADLFYFCGSIAAGWMLIPQEGEPELHLKRAAQRTALETCWTQIHETRSTKQLAAALSSHDLHAARLGMELDVVPAAEVSKLQHHLPRVNLQGLDHLIRLVRAVKSEWELSWMRAASEQLDNAMRAVRDLFRPGIREDELALSLEHILRLMGHQGPLRMRRWNGEMFIGQVVAGANAALPGALDAPLGGAGRYPTLGKGAAPRAIQEGEVLVVDLVGAANGYLSDCTRCFAVGDVGADLRRAYDWCEDAYFELADACRPGVVAGAIHERALELAADSGYADNFMGVAPDQARFIGHGLGTEIDEYPFLARGQELQLAPGMVFALEPKLVFAGRAAVGVEDTFVVTEGGVESLTTAPRGMLQLG